MTGKAWPPFTIGEFTITPYLVDHSATDAYADLRSHGRKGKLFDNFIQRPIRDIDLLFLEGTMLHRNNDLFPDETPVEDTIVQTVQQTICAVGACASILLPRQAAIRVISSIPIWIGEGSGRLRKLFTVRPI